jgi:GAF domain-containing protein
LLNNIGTTIASNLDLKGLVQTVTDSGRQVSGAEFGAFFYNSRDKKGDSFHLYAVSGISREAFEKLGCAAGTALFATFQGARAIRVDDI